MVLSSRELLTCDCYLSMTVCLCENWKLCVGVGVGVGVGECVGGHSQGGMHLFHTH